MSTGAECRFKEVEPGRYTYWLQDWPYGNCPDGRTYGPFRSFGAAFDHLHAHHANPGGFSTENLPDGEHQHDWTTGPGQVEVGVEVHIRVESLGANPDRDAVIAHIKSLPADHPAWRITKVWGWQDNITRCIACGREKG